MDLLSRLHWTELFAAATVPVQFHTQRSNPVRQCDLLITIFELAPSCHSSHVVYNLFFHPLARFPGPLIHRITRLAFVYKFLRGTLPYDILPMHEKYGPVVRIAPSELSSACADAGKDIYGHRTGLQHHGQEELLKFATFYRGRGYN
jgi:hypothetical protein